MSEIDVNYLLSQLRTSALEAKGADRVPAASANPTGLDFSEQLKDAINQVNSVQKESGKLKNDFTMGDKNVDLVDVMVASQKASISFQAMLQVRNKLLSAYQDVMSMPI
ncbi:Flagellar hook-basal body complex protein FliE [hydrothermal vent metagenome]|uniref:Flagellar hook-basal body complex protein FliE n=1 Tax=hydrothermal vent metagenome TaxID=652676 RepID=A0A3B0ZPL2_9ZZZZ